MSKSTAQNKVLVVEDDEAILRLIETSLTHEGYAVVTAMDGEAALVRCVEERPSVVILDVNLPKLDGYTVAKRLKAVDSLRQIPIIFLTARDRPADIIAGIQAGARHYLTKPFNAADLVHKVKKILPL